jgi:Fur family ferric uptake transcriptional regulator
MRGMVRSREIVQSLSGAGRRLTGTRRAVARAVAAQRGHFSAEDVLVATRDLHPAPGRATVFRSLDLLTSLGLIERVDLPDGSHAYVACQPAEHHHHLVCERCGRSTEVGDLGLSPILRRVETQTGYRIERHRLELYGLCPACARDATLPS